MIAKILFVIFVIVIIAVGWHFFSVKQDINYRCIEENCYYTNECTLSPEIYTEQSWWCFINPSPPKKVQFETQDACVNYCINQSWWK
jgi:hypothetical protein